MYYYCVLCIHCVYDMCNRYDKYKKYWEENHAERNVLYMIQLHQNNSIIKTKASFVKLGFQPSIELLL